MSTTVELENITKTYPGVTALKDVSFDIRSGEVHALTGENGAGKSTLIGIVGGSVEPTRGTIRLNGVDTKFRNPIDAISSGIAVVHQELAVVSSLSVTENVLLGNLPRVSGVVQWRAAHRRVQEVLDRLGLDISGRSSMSGLGLGQQQMVEIARALVRDARILVLDEPSAILGARDLETLYDVVRNLRTDGVGVVYISHRLGEVLALSDRITVLRDGAWQGTVETSEIDEDRLVTIMTGRQLTAPAKAPVRTDAPVLLEVQDVQSARLAHPATFTLRAGEIIGFAGLIGAGRTELARAIIGADPATGAVVLTNRRFTRRTPRTMRKQGIAYLPEDRKSQGLLMVRSILENIGISSLAQRSRAGIVRRRFDRAYAGQMAYDVRLKARSLSDPPTTLSGGNQQKVMLARWLSIAPRVLILDEPTRGIDVGGKSEIYRLMRGLADKGCGIIMISSEVEEILSMADRVLVMRGGKIRRELSGADMTESEITRSTILDSGDLEDSETDETLVAALKIAEGVDGNE